MKRRETGGEVRKNAILGAGWREERRIRTPEREEGRRRSRRGEWDGGWDEECEGCHHRRL